jgi:acyl-CoA synthetase (NDP forming)
MNWGEQQNMDNVINKVRSSGRQQLTEPEAKELIETVGIPVVKTVLCKSAREAVITAQDLGFPVAMKVVSEQIIHKSDVGGVLLDIRNSSQTYKAYRNILTAVKVNQPTARITGVTVQPMAKKGIEVIIGMSKDPQFGPVIMFGLGGILVELLKDISFRIVPLRLRDAKEMMQEIKGYPLLTGYRGQPPVNLASLESIILQVAALADSHPEIREMDLNPIIVNSEGAVVVDARVTLDKN